MRASCCVIRTVAFTIRPDAPSRWTEATVSDDVPAGSMTGEVSDSEYLRQLGVEPRFKRALGFLTGSLFAVAFQGPTTGALLITGATLAFGGPAFIWAITIIFALQLLLAVSWAELSSHYPL